MTTTQRMNRVILPLALLACCGCHSLTQPTGASFASVVIASQSTDEIRRAAKAVFTAAGYETFVSARGDLVFEKEGTRGNQIAHGGWLQDKPIKERVRTEIVSLLDGTQRLQCKAYMVEDAGDPLFEKEKRLANLRSGPYQELLDKVAERLK